MSTQTDAVVCQATLNYVGGPMQVAIRDGRRAELPGWELCGFELLGHAPSIDDWDDAGELRQHHREMAALAKQLSGCDVALVNGHIKRNPRTAAHHQDLGPIQFVHSDFADTYGGLLREQHRQPTPLLAQALEEDGVTGEAVAGARRLLVLQFWRNIGPPKMDLPLAFCDARTVPREDLVTFEVANYAGEGFTFDALGVSRPREAPTHAWYAFPEMQVDEVVAFRTYDTDLVGSADPYWTPHSAFRDPDVELGHPSRSSIELRATCLFL